VSRFWVRKPPRLLISTDGELVGVALLRLVGQVNRCPDSISDGDSLAEWSGTPRPTGGSLELTVRDWPGTRGNMYCGKVYCRLFAEPEGSVTILHPPFDDMVLYR
jgi:hypothetical protein